MKKILIFLIAIFTASLTNAADYLRKENIPYSSKEDAYSQERLKLDISYPANTDLSLPVIIWFHGGGLTGGEKFLPDELQEKGFVVIAPNYRLIPRVGVNECIDDAAEAVAWTFANVESFGGDASKIFVSGHSAGGFLTSMVGLDKSRLEKYGIDADTIAGLFPYSGQVITHFSDRSQKGIGELTPWIDANAPLFHVRSGTPPYIIITGDAERELYGRYEENLYMWRMMKLNGNKDVKIFKLDGFDHGEMAVPAHKILIEEANRILQNK